MRRFVRKRDVLKRQRAVVRGRGGGRARRRPVRMRLQAREHPAGGLRIDGTRLHALREGLKDSSRLRALVHVWNSP